MLVNPAGRDSDQLDGDPPHHFRLIDPRAPMRLPRSKTNPFRLLVASLYWNRECIRRSVGADGEIDVSLVTGPTWRLMGVPSGRGCEYLRWLQEHEYIYDLQMSRGHADFAIREPASWNWGE